MDDIVERLRDHLSVIDAYPKETRAADMAGLVQSLRLAIAVIERLRDRLSVIDAYPKETGAPPFVGEPLAQQALRAKADELDGSQHAYGDAVLYRKAADQIERLRVFAKEVIRGSQESNLDGGDIQEMAEKHGLLKPEIYDLDKHGDHEDAVPGEDTIYVFPDWMKD